WRARAGAHTGLRTPSAPGSPARAWASRRASGIPWPAGVGWPCTDCRASGSCLRSRSSPLWLSYWMPAGSRVHAAEDIACLPRVAAHLRDQRRQVGEFFFVTEPGDELDLDPATVQV